MFQDIEHDSEQVPSPSVELNVAEAKLRAIEEIVKQPNPHDRTKINKIKRLLGVWYETTA